MRGYVWNLEYSELAGPMDCEVMRDDSVVGFFSRNPNTLGFAQASFAEMTGGDKNASPSMAPEEARALRTCDHAVVDQCEESPASTAESRERKLRYDWPTRRQP